MAKRLTKAQRKAKARQLERHHTTKEIAKDRVALIDALVEQSGLAEGRAKSIADTAMDRAELPGYIGDSKLRQARAAFDTAQALFTTDWPRVGDERPETIDVSLEVIDNDEDIQIRVGGTDEDTVNSYAMRMRAGDDFPPLVVFFDAGGKNGDWHLWLADGFHRHEAAYAMRMTTPTFPTLVYAGDRTDAEEYAATCNARHGLPMSREDKRAAIRRLLKIHPAWSNREVARRVGASHPTVGKVRQALEAEAEASGKNFQMPEERVVQRGDQTYTYKPPEHETERESPYLKVWEIERGIRSYLDRVFGSTTMGFSAKDDDTVAQEQRQYLIKLRREERHDELYEHISGSFREGDIVQAVNNVIEQLRQEIERHRERQRSQAEPAPDTPQSATQSSTSPDEPPRLAEVIRERLIEGDVEGFVEALREAELDDYYTPPTPPDFHNALTTIFGSGSDAYVDPSQRRTATRCLYDAIAAGAGGEDSAPEKAQATDAAACPECGGRVIHISANGKPARDVCMECGTVIEIKEETV